MKVRRLHLVASLVIALPLVMTIKRLPGVVKDGKVRMVQVDGGTGGILYNPSR